MRSVVYYAGNLAITWREPMPKLRHQMNDNVQMLGNAALMALPKVAFLSSRKVAPSAVMRCYDWATGMRGGGGTPGGSAGRLAPPRGRSGRNKLRPSRESGETPLPPGGSQRARRPLSQCAAKMAAFPVCAARMAAFHVVAQQRDPPARTHWPKAGSGVRRSRGGVCRSGRGRPPPARSRC